MYEKMASRKATVLLVDDDDVDAMAVVRGFKKHNINNPIIRAKDGLEALDMLRTPGKVPTHFIMLLDINMPRMDGISLLKKLRADQKLAPSIAFVLTTSNGEKDRFEAYNLNVAGYCLKQNSGKDFLNLATMLDNYWRIVELPEII